MGRKKKDKDKSPSRFKSLCEKYRIDNGHLSMTEFSEKLKVGYKQSRLSQFETGLKGPPLELVEEYANYFKLRGKERLDFFVAALEASNQINFEQKKIPLVVRRIFFDLLALFLSNKEIDKTITTIEKRKKSLKSELIYRSFGDNKYKNLEEALDSLKKAITTFTEEVIIAAIPEDHSEDHF